MSIFKNWVWFFVFLSIITYPIATIRIFGMPFPVFFISISLPFLLLIEFCKKTQFKLTKIKLDLILILLFFILLTLFINLITNSSIDYLSSQFAYSLFCLLIIIFIDKQSIPFALNALYFSSIVLLIYGLYGFITWETGELIQHTFGYFGITYLESTRNGDLIYLFPGLIISYVYATNTNSKITFWCNTVLCLIFLLAILANQSRGGVIVIFVYLVMIIRQKKIQVGRLPYKLIFLISIFFILFVFLLSFYVDKLYLDIIFYRISSIFSLKSNSDISYNSNGDRIEILNTSIMIFKNHILGVGITGMRQITNGELFHSENAYFSILVYYGLPGFIIFNLFLWFIYKIVFFLKVFNNKFLLINSFLYIFLIVYSLFNLMIDLLPFWMILGLSTSSYYFNKTVSDCD